MFQKIFVFCSIIRDTFVDGSIACQAFQKKDANALKPMPCSSYQALVFTIIMYLPIIDTCHILHIFGAIIL